MEKSSYEQGLEQGKQIIGQFAQLGFATKEDCLQHQEALHADKAQNLLPKLHARNPEYANTYAEFEEGVIVGARLGVI